MVLEGFQHSPKAVHLQTNIFFQQDGGLNSERVSEYNFSKRLIGQDTSIPWPHYSPDITGLDFFICEYEKDWMFH
jgi:hypothetical protein